MDGDKNCCQGWRFVGWASVVIALICAVIVATAGFNEGGLHLVIRTTAQTSLVLFLAAFTSSALLKLSANALTKWLRRNRRYIGVSFAVSHTFHLAAILALGIVTGGAFFREVTLTTIIGGGLAYVFIFAMAATSFDSAVRWMGHKRWQLLHSIGMFYVWFIFMFSYGGRATVSLPYAAPALLLLLALALRVVAAFAERRALAIKRA